MPDQAHRVASACNLCYGTAKPCNVFTKDVAGTLGVLLPGGPAAKADLIVQALKRQWTEITAHDAILLAGKGVFIVAGLQSTEFSPKKDGTKVKDGHVCVVIPGRHGKYPRVVSSNDDPNTKAYGKSRGDHPLNGFVFSHADAPKVHYFAEPRGASGGWQFWLRESSHINWFFTKNRYLTSPGQFLIIRRCIFVWPLIPSVRATPVSLSPPHNREKQRERSAGRVGSQMFDYRTDDAPGVHD